MPNPFWQPYYPWVAYAKSVLTKQNSFPIPDNVADATINSLHTKLVNDPTIGGLALDIRPSTTTFEAIDADQPAGVIFCEYEIDYRTAYNNLST